MPSLFEPAAREQFVARLVKLTPNTPATWGKFTATQMVAHLNDALLMAMGDLPVAPRRSKLRSVFGRWFAIYGPLPWPKGVPTAPELLARGAKDSIALDVERTSFAGLVEKVATRKGAAHWPEHPIFGPMREKDWGALGHRHVEHHFKQFGI